MTIFQAEFDNQEKIQELKNLLKRQSDYQLSLETLKRGESLTLDGVQGSFFALFGSTVLEDWNRVLIVLTLEVGKVDQIADDFSLFSNAEILTFPLLPSSVQSTLENDNIFLSEDLYFGERLRCLKKLDQLTQTENRVPSEIVPKNDVSDISKMSSSKNIQPSLILVSSLAAILQDVPSRQQILDETRFLNVNQEYNREELIRWLIEGGFHSTPAVELPGEIAVRGHILDLFALDADKPVRVEFFGDEIESMRFFDPINQRSCDDLFSFELTRSRIKGKAGGSFVDHLPNNSLIMMLETDKMIHETQKVISTSYSDSRSKSQSSDQPFVSETINALYRFPTIHSVSFATGNELSSLTVRLRLQSVERFEGNMQQVRNELNQLSSQTLFGIVGPKESELKRIQDIFRDSNPGKDNRIFYLTGELSKGFDWQDESLILIGTNQLFGRQSIRKPKKKELSQVIDSFLDLSPGDLVIHVGQGLARFRGLKTITKGQQEEEHLELEFADNVSLFVPASKINLIQRYVGTGKSQPRLAKLNGSSWSRQKKAVQEAVFELATEMIELQAAREFLEGVSFPPDSSWQNDFEDSFPFRETNDQLTAITAIKNDMERSRPMDRLLCGDVGFGKTEVAIRAAFKAVDAGYQVAVLVPTTILAEQHFRVFSERMTTFPISIASLSRFSSKKEQREIIERMKKGTVDIVIGTHRIVQKDVEFARLGLVIIDEEQKFGVVNKEQLKKLRQMVDVLTMTATPIPRTLHFSLLGLRDISNLETPPDNRLPVETKVIRFNNDLIRRAVLLELNRGGQVYFLHNRVKDIDDIAHKLRQIVPEARIRVGHAQMNDEELEDVMRDFIRHQFDVLVCTTIIESGLDIPNANTIFINRANHFGLAELHQLRGRVGRDKYQAYCYLLLNQNQILTDIARKRLSAIEEYSHLGSGFNIAMRDLEIRGAGNILGTQQSGHIALVGYEMYCDFLDSAVRLLKNQPQKTHIEVEIDLPGTALISKNYVAEQRIKIDFYKRILRITTQKQCDDIRTEMIDRFGKMPIETERLFLHAQIRLAAFQLRIRVIQIAEEFGSRFLMFKYSFPESMLKLQNQLKRRNISLRLTSVEQKAYLPIPSNLYSKQGSLLEDSLLKYVLSVLTNQENNISTPQNQTKRPPQKPASLETDFQKPKRKPGEDSPLAGRRKK